MKLNSIVSLFIAIALFTISCREETVIIPELGDDSSIQSINGTWRVISFEDRTTDNVVFPNEENSWGQTIEVTFDDTTEPHSIDGKNTTNSIFGEFEYVGGRAIRVNGLGSTFVNQPALADEFLLALQGDSVSFQVNEESLRLFYFDGVRSVTLEKIE